MLSEAVTAAFEKCLDRISEEYKNLQQQVPLHPGVALDTWIDSLASVVAARIEASPEFGQLVDALKVDEYRAIIFSFHVACFLKLSGAYFDLHAACCQPDIHKKLTGLLDENLSRPRTAHTRYLIRLPWVSANIRLPVEAGWFRLRTFEASELEERINNRARRVFFPHTALDPATIDRLTHAVWLEVEEDNVLPLDTLIHLSARDGKVSFSGLPPAVERALGRLVLLNWYPEVEEVEEYWWPGFPLGPVIEVSDNLFDWPTPPTPGVLPDLFDEEGCVVEEGPERFMCEDVTALADYDHKLSALEKHEETKGFLPERVLPYLIKAATLDAERAGKVDQVVNHVLALDALLGDSEPGSARRLRTRLGTLLGLDEGQL
ncbi:MAG: hypothetical protein H5U02_14080, partial [Clostridia bacterium]|nr:hypothetical protein [Clostridia bacterium]